jgi:hypothetical protein
MNIVGSPHPHGFPPFVVLTKRIFEVTKLQPGDHDWATLVKKALYVGHLDLIRFVK